MYYIAKEIHVRKKPLWLVDLLFQISPDLYREKETKEVTRNRFERILAIIQGARVRWHHGRTSLTSIQIITHDETTISVRGKRGIEFLSFRIKSEQPLLNPQEI